MSETMKNTLDDLRVVLHRAEEEIDREGVGIGKNEIHQVAYRLYKDTNGELFDDASFNSGYRGIRSPEIRKILSFFEAEERRVLEDGEAGIDHTDAYFCLNQQEDKESAANRYDELSDSVNDVISEVLDGLESDRVQFINEQNLHFENNTPFSTACGRLTLGSEYADQRVEVAVLSVEWADSEVSGDE